MHIVKCHCIFQHASKWNRESDFRIRKLNRNENDIALLLPFQQGRDKIIKHYAKTNSKELESSLPNSWS